MFEFDDDLIDGDTDVWSFLFADSRAAQSDKVESVYQLSVCRMDSWAFQDMMVAIPEL